jgi:hypothetical protein
MTRLDTVTYPLFLFEIEENDEESLADCQQIITVMRNYGIVCEEHITPSVKNNDSLCHATSWIPLRTVWPLFEQLLKDVGTCAHYGDFEIPLLSVYALQSVGVDPADYIKHNGDFLRTIQQCKLGTKAMFADIPDAVMRLHIDADRFAVESDDSLERLKSALIMHAYDV